MASFLYEVRFQLEAVRLITSFCVHESLLMTLVMMPLVTLVTMSLVPKVMKPITSKKTIPTVDFFNAIRAFYFAFCIVLFPFASPNYSTDTASVWSNL